MSNNEIVYVENRQATKLIAVPTPRNRAGRKSEQERILAKAENLRLEESLTEEALKAKRRKEVEAKRAIRQQPDTKHSQMAAIILAGVPLAAASIISYFTTVAVATWMQLPLAWLDYAVPGMLEALVIFSSLDYIINESRKKGSGQPAFWAMVGFSAINVVGNAAHTIVQWGASFGGTNWQSYIGVVLSGGSAFVVVYLSKRISTLVFVEAA
jgi:hypothetical protein